MLPTQNFDTHQAMDTTDLHLMDQPSKPENTPKSSDENPEIWAVSAPYTAPLSESPSLSIGEDTDNTWSTEEFQDFSELPWDDDSEKCVNGPYIYITTQPGKDVRKKVLIAINTWLHVESTALEVIGTVVSMLHNASLLIDDIQDESFLRRGAPAAHHIHGVASTINSGNYVYFQAQYLLFSFPNALEMIRIFNEELVNLHRGQGMDIYWRDTVTVPTEAEYLTMVANKTGGLFRLAIRLMMAASPASIDLVPFANVIGPLFQIQDDYRNLTSAKMRKSKGYCEDLSEGKMSFPIIHAIHESTATNSIISNNIISILKARTDNDELKSYVVSILQDVTGSLKYTADKINRLHQHALQLMQSLGPNLMMEEVLSMLQIRDNNVKIDVSVTCETTKCSCGDVDHTTSKVMT